VERKEFGSVVVLVTTMAPDRRNCLCWFADWSSQRVASGTSHFAQRWECGWLVGSSQFRRMVLRRRPRAISTNAQLSVVGPARSWHCGPTGGRQITPTVKQRTTWLSPPVHHTRRSPPLRDLWRSITTDVQGWCRQTRYARRPVVWIAWDCTFACC